MLKALEKRLDYVFSDKSLLRTATTHKSHSATHYERLEFLGDSILDTVIAYELFKRFAHLPEGDLSRLRANLVKEDTLVLLAKELKLGDFLLLGDGELKSGGKSRPSILADAFEAILGALWLEAGFDKTAQIIATLYAPLFLNVVTGQTAKDAKTQLQEWLQARRLDVPKYTITESGAAHSPLFTAHCQIAALKKPITGIGKSRRIAEQEAAKAALLQLEKSWI